MAELQRDPPAAAGETNLESFIASTAVRVPARCPPQTSSAYYELTDLWEEFREWSAYGAGVPLVLNGTDGVVQYYVPFLSAIQLYASRPTPSSKSFRGLGEDSDGDSVEDTSSDVSSDCDHGQPIGIKSSCLVKNISADQEGFSSDDSESDNQESHPVFQYLEHDAPYGRQPLVDMISILTSRFPDLKRYRSCDLLPSSWISVAWYPIYRIPTGPMLQDLDACFLTFHALSTPPEGTLTGNPETNDLHNMEIADVCGKITLPLIGLASYKFSGSMWTSNQQYEQQLTASLLKDADEWLCQRQVHHPDYRFFLLR